MIVQSTRLPDEPHLVLTMEQHTATAGTLAQHFGGVGPFAPLEPRDLLLGLVREHDRGWAEVDAAAPRDPSTDLPWSVYQTPTSVSIGTGPRSIDHNERCHPYRGLLASMHIHGLFTGRYGLDQTRILDLVDEPSRALLEPMLAAETERQARLRRQLTADPATAPWLADAALLHSYKALQTFDALALWLQVTHPAGRRPTVLRHVPTTGGAHVAVAVTPRSEDRIVLDPYPFDTDPLELVIEGRWLRPQPSGADLAAALAAAPPGRQPVTLCSAATAGSAAAA
ncbi:MAG: DUF3891 family protein [Acidimicrobiales bacterium]